MSPDDRHGHAGELLMAIGLGVVVAAGGLLWCTAGLAGLLFKHRWPHLSMASVAHALLLLPRHLGDPRAAWPFAVRSDIPGPADFYLAFALLLVAGAAATAAAVRMGLLRRPARGSSAERRRGARWASSVDLTPLRPGRLGRGSSRVRHSRRLALGYRGQRLLRAEERHALVVFGPPQSGKSAGVAIPALLEWQGPAVASSVKTDLLAATVTHRASVGEVMVFDPYGLSPARGSTWSPLRAARTWDGALSTAMRMSAAGELDTTDVRGGGYWAAAAEQRLAPLLWAAAHTGGGMATVVRWAYGQGDAELPSIIHQLLARASAARELADAQAAHDAHLAFEALAGETRSSIESTVQMLLRAYRSPRVQASALGCEITPERLLAGANTLYLIGDSHRGKLLRPIFLALLQELVDAAFHEATMRGGRLIRPLLLCLDELGNVAPLPSLADIASTAPSHNIQLVSIFHDIAQARSRYREQVQTVINSHRARMLLPGVADLETLRYFSDLLGEENPKPDDLGRGRPRFNALPLAAPQQLRQLGESEALLIYGRLAPTKLRLRLYYRDGRLRRLSEGAG